MRLLCLEVQLLGQSVPYPLPCDLVFVVIAVNVSKTVGDFLHRQLGAWQRQEVLNDLQDLRLSTESSFGDHFPLALSSNGPQFVLRFKVFDNGKERPKIWLMRGSKSRSTEIREGPGAYEIPEPKEEKLCYGAERLGLMFRRQVDGDVVP